MTVLRRVTPRLATKATKTPDCHLRLLFYVYDSFVLMHFLKEYTDGWTSPRWKSALFGAIFFLGL